MTLGLDGRENPKVIFSVYSLLYLGSTAVTQNKNKNLTLYDAFSHTIKDIFLSRLRPEDISEKNIVTQVAADSLMGAKNQQVSIVWDMNCENILIDLITTIRLSSWFQTRIGFNLSHAVKQNTSPAMSSSVPAVLLFRVHQTALSSLDCYEENMFSYKNYKYLDTWKIIFHVLM